jgi:hypothetical protein
MTPMMTRELRRFVLLILVLVLGVTTVTTQSAPSQLRGRLRGQRNTVDLSEYRTATYGAPDYYCDFTKSATGTGTSGDPWNPAQCKSQPVCGDVVGVLDVASGATGTIQSFATSGLDYQEAAFRPTNAAVQGTSCGSSANGVVYVARYPAITMVDLTTPSSSTIGSNTQRTEIRHDGVADTNSTADGSGLGAPALGCYNQSYVTFDGFYIDMAQNGQSGDQGTIAFQSDSAAIITDCKAKNFAIKGVLGTQMNSNAVIYRPGTALRSVLSNFAVWDFDNEPNHAGGQNQDGLFSDAYGDQDFLIEYFLLDGVERGIYTKGCPSGRCNYGTIRYGIIRNTGGVALDSAGECLRISALHASSTTTIHNVLMVNCEQSGVTFATEGGNISNLVMRHVTIANLDSGCAGALAAYSTITTSSATVRDSIFDIAASCSGHMVEAGGSTVWVTTMTNNAYFDADGVYSWSFNGAEQASLAEWRTATGLSETGSNTISDPFISRVAGNANYYRISPAHAALTMSSTGGEVGAYADGATLGPIQN